MPPKGKLPAEAIAALERWVKEGAADPRVLKADDSRASADVDAGRNHWAFQPIRRESAPRNVQGRHLAARRRRSIPARPARRARVTACRRRRPLHLAAAGEPRPDGPAALADGRRGVPRRSFAEGVRARRRSSAGLAGLRRTLGAALARPRGLSPTRSGRPTTSSPSTPGATATTSSTHSTPTSRTTASSASRSPATCSPSNRAEQRAAQLVATGFLVLGDLTIVEADKAKLRIDVVDQQVDKIGRAFLGMTIGCARCHDHKFDPIPQRDYYALAGIFNSTDSIQRAEWGVWSWPTLAELPETEAQAERTRGPLGAGATATRRLEGRPRSTPCTEGGNRRRPGEVRDRPRRRAGRTALSKVQAELAAQIAQARRRDPARRVLRPGAAESLRGPRRRKTGRHEDHHPRQRLRAWATSSRAGSCESRVASRPPDPAASRAAVGNWPTGSPAPTTR